MSDSTLTENQHSAIDKAIAAAKARALQKQEAAKKTKVKPDEADTATESPTPKKEKKVKAPKPDPTEVERVKQEKAAVRAQERLSRSVLAAERRADRQAAREAKKANKPTSTAHSSKVEKAGAKLPKRNNVVDALYHQVISETPTEGEVAILIAHLAHYNRVRATERSRVATGIAVGDTVEIVSSDRDSRLIGRTGTVTQVRKIRVMVDLGGKKPAYLFLSDVSPVVTQEISADVEESEQEATGTY